MREGVSADDAGRLAQFAQDPAQKFRTNKVLVFIFSQKSEFDRVEVDEYDESRNVCVTCTAPARKWLGCDADNWTSDGSER